jgi:hypothetical protein
VRADAYVNCSLVATGPDRVALACRRHHGVLRQRLDGIPADRHLSNRKKKGKKEEKTENFPVKTALSLQPQCLYN